MSGIIIAIISVAATLIITKRQFLIEDRTIVAIKALLNHPSWKKRSFKKIKDKIGGFDDDELRKILVASGAVCFWGEKEKELWGFQTNTRRQIFKAIILLTFLLSLVWFYLFYSGLGLLISSDQVTIDNNKQETLICRYYAGLSLETRQYWYAPNGMMGKSVCPRTINFK